MNVPDPLPLRSIPVPTEVSSVAGCDCGGVEWHKGAGWNDPGCSIWSLPAAQQQAAVHAAQDRLTAFSDALTVKLRSHMKS